jgi:photosystem II stability/assembly factor-like uncharacterized protein
MDKQLADDLRQCARRILVELMHIRIYKSPFRVIAVLATLCIAIGWLPCANASPIISNGARTWASQASGTRNQLNAVDFTPNGQHGWAVGFGGTILATANGGRTWVSQASGTRNQLNAVDFTPDGQHGWAVGFDGTILSPPFG